MHDPFLEVGLGLKGVRVGLSIREEQGTGRAGPDARGNLAPKAAVAFDGDPLRGAWDDRIVGAVGHAHETSEAPFQIVSHASVFIILEQGPGETCLDAAGRVTVEAAERVRKELPDGLFEEGGLPFFLK